ncbi:MAG: hypothetical protein AAF539_08735 [Planctomycetota bacterium]
MSVCTPTSTVVGQNVKLTTAMQTLAGDIAKILRNHSQARVIVESFDPPNNIGGGDNLQIQRRLKEALDRQVGVDVVDETQIVRLSCWSVRGEYSIKHRKDPATQTMTTRAQVTARIFDQENSEQMEIAPFPIEISDLSDLTVLANATFDAGESANSKNKASQVAAQLTASIQKPNISIDADQGRIAASDSSPYAIELLISEGLSTPPKKRDYVADATRIEKNEFTLKEGELGFAVADLRAGEFYAVQLHNDSNRDVAVKLYVDGLSSFEFTEIASYKQTDHWIVPARSSAVVYGWHRTNEFSDSFEIAHLPETAIGQSGRSNASAGIIQAVFFQAWSQGETPPAGEITRGVALDSLATKPGAKITTDYVELRRFTSKTPIASIAVRYNKPKDDLPPSIVSN